MSNDPTAVKTTVEYDDAEPASVTVITQRWNNDYAYKQVYEFAMAGSSAILAPVEGDGDGYLVRKNEGTRRVAREAVEDLPFVQGVVMFDD